MSKIDKNVNIDITPVNTHIKSGVRDSSFRESKTYQTYNKGLSSSLFAYIILVLFVIAFSHYIRTGTFINFSFKSLIDRLSQMPDISVSFASIDLTIYGDWGAFNFLRSFLNFFTSSFEILITLSGFGIQALVVIFFLVSLFFV